MKRAGSLLAAAALALCAQAVAVPNVTGPQARAFLGGRTGKIVFIKGVNDQIYFLDFNDSVLVERRVTNDQYCLSPMISPDGSRIVYEAYSSIWIRSLKENAADSTRIFTRPQLIGQTMEPHWWVDPKTKDEYITYTTGIIEDHEWPPKKGSTYMQKIDKTNKPVGGPLLLMPFMMSAARSKNGTWGGSSHHSTGMYKFYPDKLENAFFDGTNWLDSGALLACNASMSPSNDPARQNRLMHLSSGGYSAGGTLYDNHKAVFIRSWTDPDPNHPLWWMGLPGDRCDDDGSGNLFWGTPEWSTDEEYFTATGSKEVDVVEGDLYAIRLNYAGNSRLLRVLKGGGKNLFPHLWVKDGVLPARLQLDKTSLSFAGLRQDAANPKPDTIKVSNAGDGVLPVLQIGPLPKWLKVTVLANGTNAPRLVNAASRDSVPPGSYQAKVTVSFGQGADSVDYSVSFQYSDPVLTVLQPRYAQAVLLPGDSLQLTAKALDQTGNPLPVQPPMTWRGTGALRPSSDGWFRADSAYWRTYPVIGTALDKSCTTYVTVVRTLLRLDAGAAGQAPPGWKPDGDYALGGGAGQVPDSLAPTAFPDPAPAGVYRSFRAGYSGFDFPGLPDGRYRVRFHFVDAQAAPAAGLTVRLEGAAVLEDYRLPAPAGDGLRATAVEERLVTVSDANGLQLEAVAPAGAPALAGLELYDLGLPPVSLLSPNGGERYNVGDTLAIRWRADSAITSCGIQISLDGGKQWLPITRTRSVGTADPDWQDFRWTIPAALDGFSLASQAVMVSVYDYFGSDRDRSDRPFAIGTDPVGVGGTARKLAGLARLPDGRLRLDLGAGGAYLFTLSDLRGRRLRAIPLSGAGERTLDLGVLPAGLYRCSLAGSGPAGRVDVSRMIPWMP